jgi:RNA polymerase sigma-70 factor, ECF subfamily
MGFSPALAEDPDLESRPVDDTRERDRREVDRAVDRAQAGDREGIQFLYVRYSSDVYRFVRSIVGDEHDAEDVTQTVFLKLMSVISKYRREKVPFAAWLIRVARNAAIDHVRERRPVPCEEIRASTADPFEGNEQRLNDLKDAIAGVQRKQREVVVLRQVCGFTPSEIAALLGKSEGAIHGLHHRGRRAVQARLSERGAVPVTRLMRREAPLQEECAVAR